MFNNILVPFDGSNHAENALRTAINLVKEHPGALVTVLYVQVDPFRKVGWVGATAIPDDLEQRFQEEGDRVVQSAKDMLADADVPYEVKTIVGDPAKEICDLAVAKDIDLIVMGSRGLGVMAEMALGSVSHKVIHHTSKPVLIVK